MEPQDQDTLDVTTETNCRKEVMEMHLFDTDVSEENALCRADTSADDRRGANGYLEDRLGSVWIGTVCEGCKTLAAPFAVKISRDLEDEGLLDEAEEYRELVQMLSNETDPKPSGR